MVAMCGFVGLCAWRNGCLFSDRPDMLCRKYVDVVVCFFVNRQTRKARWTLSEVRWTAGMGIKKAILLWNEETDVNGSDTSRRTVPVYYSYPTEWTCTEQWRKICWRVQSSRLQI